MKVLVTGGTGFVGSHAVRAVLARGHEVRCLVRSEAKLAATLGDAKLEAVRGDLFDADALARGAAGVDAVLHVAGLTAATRRNELFAVNAEATARLVELALREAGAGVRFVHVGSLAAAGPSAPGAPLRGGEDPRPVSDYGRSKLAGEQAVRGSDLDWIVLRPPAVYGPGDREFLRLFRAVRGGFAPVFGDGSQELSFVFAPDLADALADALESEAGGVHYPAHPEVRTAKEFTLDVARALGRKPPLCPGLPAPLARAILAFTGGVARLRGRATLLSSDKANEFLAPAWTCSPASLEEAVGWRAATPLTEGLERTAAAYREARWI